MPRGTGWAERRIQVASIRPQAKQSSGAARPGNIVYLQFDMQTVTQQDLTRPTSRVFVSLKISRQGRQLARRAAGAAAPKLGAPCRPSGAGAPSQAQDRLGQPASQPAGRQCGATAKFKCQRWGAREAQARGQVAPGAWRLCLHSGGRVIIKSTNGAGQKQGPGQDSGANHAAGRARAADL